MHIGVDIKVFRNNRAGIAVYLRSVLDQLQEFDTVNRYTLFTPAPCAYSLTNPLWKMVCAPSRLPGTVWVQWVLPRHVQAQDCDVFWGPEFMIPLNAPVGVTCLVTIHDIAFRKVPATVPWPSLIFLSLFMPLILRRAQRVFVISASVKTDLCAAFPRRVNPDRIVITPNGAPDWHLPTGYRRESRLRFLLFAGSIEPRKNLGRLVTALEILHTQGLDVPLRIVGPPGWKNKAFHQKIAASPVRTAITFCGYVTTQELQQMYCSCHALVFPSVYEGFGLPVLEAFRLDCPVLTSRGSAMESVAGLAALYFDPYDPVDMARVIASVYEPGFDRDSMCAQGNAVVGRYSWEGVARTMMDVFGNAL